MPRLILHVGTGKTGTTSIQVALRANEEALLDRGFHVVETNRPFARSAKHKIAWADPADPGWDELAEEVERVRPTGRAVVLSNEALWQADPEGLRHLARVFEGYTPTVVLYVREQAEFVQSLLLQKQKKPEKAVDLSDRDKVDRWIGRRQLDYHEVCATLEGIFGKGSVNARLFDRSAFLEQDLLLDFLHTIGVPDPASLDLQQTDANPSIASEFAPILARHRNDPDKDLRYEHLQDIACRLTANGLGSRYFLPRDHVEAIRNRYRESNRLFASTYLQNAYALPERDAWTHSDGPGEQELEATLLGIAKRVPTLGQRGWTGARRVGRRLFLDGWRLENGESRGAVEAHLVAPRAMVRFRTPFRHRYRHGQTIEVAVRTLDDRPLRARVVANGEPLGELTFPADTIRIPLEAADPYDEIELLLEPTGDPTERPPVVGIGLPSMRIADGENEPDSAEDADDADDAA